MQEPTGDGDEVSTELPPPGWYANPSGEGGVRWWNGLSWAATPSPASAVATQKAPLRPPSLWFAESVGVCGRVASELFTLIALLILPAFIALAVAVWFAFRDAALLVTIDPDSNVSTVEGRGGEQIAQGAVWVAVALTVLWVCTQILGFASSIHAVQADARRPAVWFAPLQLVAARLKGIAPVALVHAALFVALIGVVFAAEVAVGFVFLLLPVIGLVALVSWVRFGFSPAAAVVGAGEGSAFRQSSSAATGRSAEMLGRALFLGSWTLMAAVFFLFITRLISAGAADETRLPGTTDRFLYSFTGSFGDNVYLWILVMLLGGIFWGAIVALWSGAKTLLFKELGGELRVEDYPLVIEEAESER